MYTLVQSMDGIGGIIFQLGPHQFELLAVQTSGLELGQFGDDMDLVGLSRDLGFLKELHGQKAL